MLSKTGANCLETKNVSEFSKSRYALRKTTGWGECYRVYCKKCRAYIGGQKQLEKKLDIYPHLYFQCENEDCNHIVSTRRFSKCPKCGKSKP